MIATPTILRAFNPGLRAVAAMLAFVLSCVAAGAVAAIVSEWRSMKKLVIALALAAMAVPSQAKVAGKLDLANPVVDVIVFREMNDGMWLGGAQKTIWKLERVGDGVEVLHLAAFWASRPELNSHMVYGPSVGANVGGLVHELALKVAGIAEIAYACPPWVAKVGNWASLDVYGGYRPTIGYDEHHWAYGVGGKVTIPLGTTWQQFVSKEQGGGL